MKVMVFVDHDNFNGSIKNILYERKQDRVIDYHKLSLFVLEYLSNNIQYSNNPLTHVRTYLYTGEYTDQLLSRIKRAISESKEVRDKEHFEAILRSALLKKDGQKKFFFNTNTYYFFEVRRKPLQFSQKKGIFQKGVDVQLAVDLVSNAYLNNYDIAVVLSGDIDLLESLRLVKSRGKHIILFSHNRIVAKEMIKESDMFLDISRMDDELLNKFSHIYQKKADAPQLESVVSQDKFKK